MPKREPDPEPIEDIPAEPEAPMTVGERLRAAREEKKMRLEDIAAQTRIPQRHLEALERSEWDQLPAPTYTTGFAKSYAGAVGLDRMEIGDQLRAEMGGQRFTANTIEAFEPADPRRTMPKSLVIGTIVGLIVLIALMSWLNQRSLQTPDESANVAAAAPEAAAPATTPAPQPAAAPASGPVVLTATAPVWLQVSEKGGASLFSGMLQPNQTYTVPATATAPVLKTGKPEALRISVGNQVAPAVGPAATTVSNVSLLGPDLMKAGAAAPAPAATAPAPVQTATRPARAQPRPRAAVPPPAPTEAPPPATNTTE
jgi:cytoskeletal protein RodZ